MPQRMRADCQLITHDNYATTTSPATKTLPLRATSIFIQNVDSSISLLISFDASATFKTLLAGQSLSLDVDNIKSYTIKSASGTPSAECLYGSEV